MAAPQKPITPPQRVSKTGTDVVVNGGGYPVEMVPGVPARNTPTRALTPAEASVPIRPTPATKAMAAAKKGNVLGSDAGRQG
jgi:hypothetical protein